MSDFVPNYDEELVPRYTLPDALCFESGEPVRSQDDWCRRREELLQLFASHVYGQPPGPPANMRVEIYETSADALDGLARRKQIRLHFGEENNASSVDLLLYLPAHADGPVPVFAGLNFFGNHAVQDDPHITLSKAWMRESERFAIVNHRATEASRGRSASRWPVREIVQRGYGLATMYCGDLAPDSPDHYREGVQRSINPQQAGLPEAEEAGAIGLWAWGLRRILDYLETDSQVDATRVAAIGHSRLGKTALWAAALDSRFAMAISNNSGCTGAALSRRRFGETVARINTAFPHWFCGNYKQYNDREDALPIDQHMLLALIAPRPVYVASASEDRWADPRGEFLAQKAAAPVYRLLGADELAADEMPAMGTPVHGSKQAYHIRNGPHALTQEDWAHYLNYADCYLT